MARWEDVLDDQLTLVQFWDSDLGKGFAEGYAADVLRKAEASGDPAIVPIMRRLTFGMAERLAVSTFNADPVYVDPDIMTIVEAAIPGFHPEPLQPTDLITQSGFMVLPRPLRITDRWGKSITYRAIAWSSEQFTGAYRYLDGALDDRRDAEVTPGVLLALYHSNIDRDDYWTPLERTIPLLLSHVTPWVFGGRYPDGDMEHGADANMTDVARQVQCIWRLMLQTLADRRTQHASRAYTRRWARIRREAKAVTIVRLRRPEAARDPDAEHHTVDWTHRWLVGGHWRNQWYPSLSLHRQVWISPYVKGPDDKPLEVKKMRVFEFVR